MQRVQTRQSELRTRRGGISDAGRGQFTNVQMATKGQKEGLCGSLEHRPACVYMLKTVIYLLDFKSRLLRPKIPAAPWNAPLYPPMEGGASPPVPAQVASKPRPPATRKSCRFCRFVVCRFCVHPSGKKMNLVLVQQGPQDSLFWRGSRLRCLPDALASMCL
jgi:hypothetical protein